MNKIYKIVWNNALQCYTVVSELAKSHSRSSKTKVIGTALFTSLLALSGQADADELPQDGIIDKSITVDSINVKDNRDWTTYVFKENGNLTVNKDIAVYSSTESTYLFFTPYNTFDENGNQTFDLSGSLHVKGNFDVTTNSTQSDYDSGDSSVPFSWVSSGVNTTIDGSVNIKSNNKYNIKYKNTDGNEQVTKVGGALFSLGGRTTIEKDLNVEKSSLNITPIAGAINNKWFSIADSGKTQVNGNAKFTDGSLDVLGNLSIKGDLSLDNSLLSLTSYTTFYNDGKEEKQQYTDHASINVGGNLKISGVTDDGSTIYNTVAGDAILNVAGNVDVSGSNSIEIRENSTATIGGDLNLTHVEDTNVWSQVKANSSLTVNGDLNMKGHYMPGYYTKDNDIKFFRNDFIINGENGGASTALIKGDVNLTDNSHFMTQTYGQSPTDHTTYHPRDDFEKLSSTTIEGNLNVERNSRLGAYSASDTVVKGNATVTSGGSIEAWNSDAYLNIAGDTLVTDKNSQIGLGRTGDIDIGGKLSVKNGANVYIEDDSTLSVAKSLTLENSLIEGYKAKLNVGGDLTITNNTDESIWNKLDRNSELTINGDLNMKGQYKEGVYDENNEDGYFKNNLFISGAGNNVGSTALIKGDVHLSDNSHFFTETYSQPAPDHETYHSRDEFKQLSSTTIEGNVTIDSNSRLGTYSASDTVVKGNATVTSGGSIEAWNSDAYLGIQGDVLVTDENSQVGVGRTADIDIDGRLTAKNGADVYIGKESTLSVAKKFLVDNATLEIHGGQLLLSGEDSVLDLTNNGVLKTDEAGSISIEKGASVNSKTKTLLSDDTTTTADGVAEKTFEADALSKVSLVDFDKEVSLDEAKRLHSVLFNSDTGILDLKIASDEPSKPDSGNASFDDAINAGGTTSVEDKTITDVDTSDKKLSDLTSSDLSWGSASLKDGQTDLDLGSGNLVLNNPESNQGSFVSTSDGSVGNITMDKDANLALNGTGSIGNVNTTENGTGDILIGNDKSGSVTANNLGSEDKAFGSVSVGAGSSVTVKNILNATKVALEKKAEVIASVINSPELKAIGDDIKIKAENSVLGGLLSGNNSTLESKTLELADNFNVLGGAKVKAKNLS
ncbi:MAG: ESPR-type extended signal peptide-containing protein, partial [Succinatimonas sp.]|nr:ESPR-type extended signal peptide-containing protein [Succinatimonas sp.]